MEIHQEVITEVHIHQALILDGKKSFRIIDQIIN